MAKKQTSTTQRGHVKLREKKQPDGSHSLYLDIYSNGKRVKEYLKLGFKGLHGLFISSEMIAGVRNIFVEDCV